ncbi:MAG: hypothetical protein Ta2E_00950 [Mycoplasmoidaceae bacterium]|nr:MAG: hypothetical protein Ta2E_00950 [Mycoplasmoidaceae bacterium]
MNSTGNMIPMLVPNPHGGFLDINDPITSDQNHNINFQNVWDRYKFFLHSGLSTAKFNYVCEENENITKQHQCQVIRYKMKSLKFEA